MAGQLMNIRIDDSAWQRTFNALTARMADMTPIMGAIGMHMEGSVKRTLQEGGSPAGSFTPVLRGGKPLVDTGQTILGGIHVAEVGAKSVAIASGFQYSGVHQFGATITAKNAPYLVFQVGDQWASKKEVTIPPRPFMVFRPEDPSKIAEIARRSVEGAMQLGL